MKLLVIGDVHGCYFTLKRLVKTHWSGNELLIQLGDLINKGPHSGRCIRYWMKLERKNPGKVLIIRGNHEQRILDYFDNGEGDLSIHKLLLSAQQYDVSPKELYDWVKKMPLKWENDNLCITHAGVAAIGKEPYSEKNIFSVLNNRSSLKNLGKTQILGHNMVKGNKPVFNSKENAWYIDTGAWMKKYLSALKVNSKGTKFEVIQEERSSKDSIF